MRRVLSWVIAVSALLPASCQTGLTQTENQAADARKVVVESFVISGTRAVDSAELAEITNSMSGSTFNDDAEELQERIASQFQDHGYFKAEVKHLDIKVIDPLASPKPVQMEAEVSEGPLCRLSAIDFTGNHALSSQELRAEFLLKTGDVFARAKIAGGLENMRRLYGSHGFLESSFIPDVPSDSAAKLNIKVKVEEGAQYRMDKLEITGPPEVAERLQARWELVPGAIFDATYVKTFLERNSSLLPASFTESSGVALLKDCSDATVSVHLYLAQDPQHGALDRPKHVDCSPPPDKKKKSD